MSKGDLLVERGAQRLQELADKAASRGDGIGEWLSEELRHDAVFLRKLKPSLIQARARGNAPTNREPVAAVPSPDPGEAPTQPKPPSAPKKAKKKRGAGGGPPPVVIVGAALLAGILLAKVVDWRGHAHPRD